MGARTYDPSTGTFLTTDPVTAPTDPQSLNNYSYNPISQSDPSGLRLIDDVDSRGNVTQWVKPVISGYKQEFGINNCGSEPLQCASALGARGQMPRLSGRAVDELSESDGEVFYRTMSMEEYHFLMSTGRVKATGETFISDARAYFEKYRGTLVQFTVWPAQLTRWLR